MYIATAQQMRNIDKRAADKYCIPSLLLMENAAHGILRIIEENYGPIKGRKITIVCGKGNNGGDGLAVARLLHNRDAVVQVILLTNIEGNPPLFSRGGMGGVFLSELKGDAETNLNIALKMGINIAIPSPLAGELQLNSYQIPPPSFAGGGRRGDKGEGDSFSSNISSYDIWAVRNSLNHSYLIIDAIFGTGLSAHVKEEHLEIIELINDSGRPVISVDIPTGINSDTGEVMGDAVKADATITFAIPKRGHFLYPGSELTGRLHIVDISIPEQAIEEEGICLNLLTEDDMTRLIPDRLPNSHKGSFGHVLVIAGSLGKGGAAAMTSLSCLKTGAGLVTLATPESVQPVIAGRIMEAMTCPLPETDEHTIGFQAIEKITEIAKDKDVVAIGPGLTTNGETVEVIRKIINELNVPVVIDADGINAFISATELLKNRKTFTILTPHPGEMAGLTGKSSSDIQKDRIGIARDFAINYGIILILKGAHTIIAEPSGTVYINPTGNPGMATAGTGDALTGIIAGLIAQNIDISSAVRLGVYLHGLAGDIAAKEKGMQGMIAGDLIERIPEAIRQLKAMSRSKR
ncbi:MAG: NAD(P)H-hydrate dehydratase [Nitrospirae bacterium]|nr:NAD(P)H-hydrate dehydratase [Nitrospirota bacterium]